MKKEIEKIKKKLDILERKIQKNMEAIIILYSETDAGKKNIKVSIKKKKKNEKIH
jgi:hypothetical protein